MKVTVIGGEYCPGRNIYSQTVDESQKTEIEVPEGHHFLVANTSYLISNIAGSYDDNDWFKVETGVQWKAYPLRKESDYDSMKNGTVVKVRWLVVSGMPFQIRFGRLLDDHGCWPDDEELEIEREVNATCPPVIESECVVADSIVK